jgi:hypothetical protein
MVQDDFNPDDMFGTGTTKKDSSSDSDESLLADDVYTSKPINYAYDAYQEKLDMQRREASLSGHSGEGGSLGGGAGEIDGFGGGARSGEPVKA